ncbi:unnamed protein product, partial [Polarella glacialis]
MLAGVKSEGLRFWIGNRLPRAPDIPPGYKPFETLATRVLLDWLDAHVCQNTQFKEAKTVLIMTENSGLGSQLYYFEHALRKLLARTAIHRREQRHIVFVPLTEVTGLDQVHFTWGAVFPLEALSTRYQEKNFVLWDCDAAPTALYDILDLMDIVDVTTSITHPEWDLRRIWPGIMVVSEKASNVNASIVYLIGNPAGSETEDWIRGERTVEEWHNDIDAGRMAMLNTVDYEGIDTLWDEATNAPYDLDIPDVLTRVQDWQQKARQASG